MAQQQFLLLILAFFIVGLAIMMGIDGFHRNQDKLVQDEIDLEASMIARVAMEWKSKPKVMGGGADQPFLSGLSFNQLGYQASNVDGTSSKTETFSRTFHNLDTARPHIEVLSSRNPDIRTELFLFGPAKNCYIRRKGVRVGSKWVNEVIPGGINSAPDGCRVWKAAR